MDASYLYAIIFTFVFSFTFILSIQLIRYICINLMLASLVRPPEFHQIQFEKSQNAGVPRIFIRGLYCMT